MKTKTQSKKMTSHLLNVGAGAGGVVTLDALTPAPDTTTNVLKAIVAIISIIPSIISLFKKKKNA